MNNKQKWTDQDLDALLETVEQVVNKAESEAKALKKSKSLKKDEDDKDDTEDSGNAEATGDAAPAPAASDEAAAPVPPTGDNQQSPSAEGNQPPVDQAAEGDQQLEGEQQEDAPLTDEELQQIYSSMPPEELERHFSILRQALSSAYGEQGQEQAQAQGQPAPAAPAPAAPTAPEMAKSEEIIALEKKVAEQAQAIEQITKAFEVLAKPTRKSITDIQIMAKSENDEPKSVPLTKSEIRSAYMKIPAESLSKSDRDLANRFFLYNENEKEMKQLINSKGGK